MSMTFFFSLAVSMAVMVFPMVSHPLNIGVMLVMLVVIFSLMISFNISSWYGCILFIIYVGALLVMFAYVVVLAYNPRAKMFSWGMYFFLVSIGVIVNTINLMYEGETEYVSSIFNSLLYWDGVMMSVSVGSLSLVGLVVYLLICLVVVVKISMFRKSFFRFFSTK